MFYVMRGRIGAWDGHLYRACACACKCLPFDSVVGVGGAPLHSWYKRALRVQANVRVINSKFSLPLDGAGGEVSALWRCGCCTVARHGCPVDLVLNGGHPHLALGLAAHQQQRRSQRAHCIRGEKKKRLTKRNM